MAAISKAPRRGIDKGAGVRKCGGVSFPIAGTSALIVAWMRCAMARTKDTPLDQFSYLLENSYGNGA